MSQTLHIVSLDVPYPANYGAMIDVYHRCKALTEIGVRVILHCFEYGRGKHDELLEVAAEVHYYSRSKNPLLMLLPTPFIVRSRMSLALLKKLSEDQYPIIFEGIHTCGFVGHPKLKNRWVGVRAHNIEHNYYQGLAQIEPKWHKRLFFNSEGKKLKRFEKWCFPNVNAVLSVSHADDTYFQKNYRKSHYIPVFNPLSWGTGARGKGQHALLHGNLSVIENIKGIEFVLNEVWQKDWDMELIIAGKDPSEEFKKYLAAHPTQPTLIENPSDAVLNELIREARINLLPTFQATGLKHKLLNALSNGGFCLATPEMVHGTGLEELCVIGTNAAAWKMHIEKLKNQSLLENEIAERTARLQSIFDNQSNAERIVKLVAKGKE